MKFLYIWLLISCILEFILIRFARRDNGLTLNETTGWTLLCIFWPVGVIFFITSSYSIYGGHTLIRSNEKIKSDRAKRRREAGFDE
jgi:hypothetical protein